MLPVMTLLLTTALPKIKTPPPETRPMLDWLSPIPPVMVHPSIEKSVRALPVPPLAKMTAERPRPVASIVVTAGPAQMTWMSG